MRPEPERAPEGPIERRRRRLTFLLWLAPGPILIVAAVNVWGNPWLLAGGLAWCALVLVRARLRPSSPLFRAAPKEIQP